MADLEVLYNSECPICNREINHYKKISKNNINFIPISTETLKSWSLSEDQAAKKLHARLNGKQIDGNTDDVLDLGDLNNKFISFGWEVIELNDGNSINEIINKIKIAKTKLGHEKPIVILMKTEMGNGVDFMMNTHAWHGKAPNNEQLKIALSQNKQTLGDY